MKRIILLLLLLSCFTVSQICYVRIIDMTGDNYETIDVYQNDNMSTRFIKTLNTTTQHMSTVGAVHGYTFVINPTRKAVLEDFGNPNQLAYLYRLLPWGLGILILIIFILIIYKKTK